MSKRWRNLLGYGFGILVLGAILYIGGSQAVELAVTPHYGYLIACLLANVAVYSVSAIRWGYTTNNLVGKRITTYPRYFSYFVTSRFFGQYISQAGGDFMVKPGLLKQINGLPLKSGLSSIVIEKLFDLSLIIIIFIPSLLFLFKIISESIALVIVSGFSILFILLLLFQTSKLLKFLVWCYNLGLNILKKIPFLKRLVQDKQELSGKYFEDHQIIRRRTILTIFSLTLLRFFLLITRLYLLNESLELGIPLSLFVAGLPIAQLALALAITPGSLGFLEGGWYGVLTLGGIGEIERSAFLIAQRAYWSIFIGLIFLATYLLFGTLQLINTRSLKDDS